MKYIITNWKMNPQTSNEAEMLFLSLQRVVVNSESVKMVSCPPTPFLPYMKNNLVDNKYMLGAQNCHWEESGAHTGEYSVQMLKDVGVKYVILGHSERNKNETHEEIAKKIYACLLNEMFPVICLGEEERDRRGIWKRDIARIFKLLFSKVPKKYLGQVIIAYEPIWAIGVKSKKPATAKEFTQAREIIKKELTSKYKTEREVNAVPIIYGGSVNDKNVGEFLEVGADGFFLGRASMDPRIINTIIKASDNLQDED